MIGLDTTETVDPRKPVQVFGREASVQAGTILGGQPVFLKGVPSQVLSTASVDGGLCLVRIGPAVQPRHDRRKFAIETCDLPYRYRLEFTAEGDARTHESGLRAPDAFPTQ